MATEALLPDRVAREKIQCSIAVAAATSAGERRRVEEEEEEGTTEEEAQESAWREEEEAVVVEMSVGGSGGAGWRQYRVVRWGRNKVYEPLLIILRRGTEPKQLAMSGALGLTLGVFPICGVTVFLCAAAVAILGGKCNAATVMLANFVATPIELGLILPFLRVGEWIFGSQPFELSKDALWQAISGQASKKVLLAILHALVGWAVVAPFMFIALYSLFLPLIWWSRQHFSAQDRPLNQRLVLVNEEVLLPTKDFGE